MIHMRYFTSAIIFQKSFQKAMESGIFEKNFEISENYKKTF